MKKILGVIFFSLFLYGCPSTEGLNTTGVWKYPWPQGLTKNQFKVTKDGTNYDDFTINYDGNGDVVFSFANNMRYMAYSDPGNSNSELVITIDSPVNKSCRNKFHVP